MTCGYCSLRKTGWNLGAQAKRGRLNPGLVTHGKSRSRIYRIWSRMKARCLNPKTTHYADYGGRGITLCERWLSFENFLEDMGEPARRQSIDRIDNNGSYEPDNCRWADRRTQSNNRRDNLIVEALGQRKTVNEWAAQTGLKASTIRRRIKGLGWSEERAVTAPIKGEVELGERS